MDKKIVNAYLALAVVCIVWGTTYFAMRIGVATFPAFLFSGIRQVTAGTLMMALLLLAGQKLTISRRDITRQFVAGTLMIALGNGVVGWAERYIPSGLAALIVSVMPVYVVLIGYVSGADRKAVNAYLIMGLLLGCVGVSLIFRDNLADLANPNYLYGILAAFFACFCWAAGTVYTKHKPSEAKTLVNVAFQLTSGGVVLLMGSVFLDDYSQLATISPDSLWALLYLIIFGSLASYGCFLYALKHLPSGLASIYAYVNPFIALLLGYFFLNEKLTWITALALTVTLGGVYFVNRSYRPKKAGAYPAGNTDDSAH
ncbi:DMT family transporter [Parapedobacter koreensis]|uniref:Permease of the drug/metabolite transporter (DMT) superfamily n=1 Tax=Parapedobacter koreensis TaxID=332977 RepID=A0A1H7LDJ8_9SPHI|nr:EamA family transporter [Parapedobacter koreensis]SEK96625.1 Permease of the drug/metabolite transporter (DMT) superfamily [Parapedobacter koreensis]